VLLNELGLDEKLISPLRTNYLMPITRLLYPECGGNTLDSHKAFTVHYKMGEDLDLSYHYDNAEVTLNVSLGKEFIGGELFFGDMRQSSSAVKIKQGSYDFHQENTEYLLSKISPALQAGRKPQDYERSPRSKVPCGAQT
ncbi:2-oxoglutarate and iron-dependent oxygenase domain-containing protein 2, partial [Stylophora pistillata]